MALVELLVGTAIGLLVILSALAAFGLSRGLSGSVNDLSQLQQQGSYALHVIGTQFRQTGSIDPILDPASGRYVFDSQPVVFGGTSAAVWGSDGSGTGADSVSVAFAPSSLTRQGSPSAPWQRDCVGAAVQAGARLVRATFSVDGSGQLNCTGVSRTQGVIRNVADFQARYRVRTGDGLRVMTATEVEQAGLWGAVSAIEVCLDLAGSEKGPDAGTVYTDCQGQPKPRDGSIHLVFHNVFAIRTP